MAESRAEQGAFGWGADTVAPADDGATTRRARRQTERRRAPTLAGKRTAASAGESPLPADNELWDVHAAARFLKRSASWVYHKAEDGTLPVKRIGGWGVRFIPSELRAWVESGCEPARRG